MQNKFIRIQIQIAITDCILFKALFEYFIGHIHILYVLWSLEKIKYVWGFPLYLIEANLHKRKKNKEKVAYKTKMLNYKKNNKIYKKKI